MIWIEINIIPSFISKDKLNEFINVCDKNFNESTFKKYIKNYSKFLNQIESDFYNSLSLQLVENIILKISSIVLYLWV